MADQLNLASISIDKDKKRSLKQDRFLLCKHFWVKSYRGHAGHLIH